MNRSAHFIPSPLRSSLIHSVLRICRLFLGICWGGIILCGIVSPAWAADELSPLPDVAQPLPPATNPQAEDISFEKVSQFVRAYLQVLALLDRREGDLQAAETELESLRLQQEVEIEAFHLIEASGLTLQEYLQLLGLANTDPEFGERVATLLQEIPLD
ncbi:DUF4168 domain-containing protein [Leptolyngbya sp. FACHB-16]|nr:DUF4168 domain-containing protein [Leptolyngbya sp. FACHB-8]MBD2154780.1 DUF4168 domain-containing protein [Leptolyngbya sp. FACHB-16]